MQLLNISFHNKEHSSVAITVSCPLGWISTIIRNLLPLYHRNMTEVEH